MRVLRFLLGLSTRLKIVIAVVVVALGIFAIAYFEPHKLWIDEEVNEDFPAPVVAATTTVTSEATPVTEAPTTTSPPATAAPDEPATTTTLDVAETSQAENPERGFSPASEEEQENPPATTVPAAEEPATTTTAAPATTTTTVAPTTTTAPPTTTTVPEGPVLLSSSEWISIGHPGYGHGAGLPPARRFARDPIRGPGGFQRP